MLYDLMIIHFSILVQLLKFSTEIVFRSQQIRIENSKWKMEAGPMGRRELEYLDSALASNLRQKDDNRRKQLKRRNVKGQSKLEGLDSPTFVPRGSILHRKGKGDHNSLSSSPVVPTYMYATESYSPYKNKLFLISSITTKVPSGGWIGKTSGF